MEFEELVQLAGSGEAETLEFKKSTGQLQRAGETLCAFLNGQGGRVLIGVTDEGKIAGQAVTDTTLQGVAEILRRLEPAVYIPLIPVLLPGSERRVLVLEAWPVPGKQPYVFDGRAYRRIGTTTSIMPQDQYQTMLLARSHSQQRWENAPATGISLADLDATEIRKTLQTSIDVGRLHGDVVENPADILDRLGLRADGVLLNAAVVLFSNKLLPNYSQCHIRMARFKGTTKTEFIDNKQVYGHALQLLREAQIFLDRHLPVAGRIIEGKMERQDRPLFPPLALREALVNALCHRDYSNPGGAVSLAIFDDRLEIWSDGTLPFGLRVEDLKRDHQSRPRNPLIAETFFRRGLVERWGRGTQTIVQLCLQAGHPEPEFIEQAGAVGVRFPIHGYVPPQRVGHDLTQRQRAILQILSYGTASLREIVERMDDKPSSATVRAELYQMKQWALVELEGFGRGSKWHLVDQRKS